MLWVRPFNRLVWRPHSSPTKQAKVSLDINGAIVGQTKRKEKASASRTGGHAQEQGQSQGWARHLRQRPDGCRRENQWPGKVTLLALVSQRSQPQLSPTVHGFFRNNSSITGIHAPFPAQYPSSDTCDACLGVRERYLHETPALI